MGNLTIFERLLENYNKSQHKIQIQTPDKTHKVLAWRLHGWGLRDITGACLSAHADCEHIICTLITVSTPKENGMWYQYTYVHINNGNPGLLHHNPTASCYDTLEQALEEEAYIHLRRFHPDSN